MNHIVEELMDEARELVRGASTEDSAVDEDGNFVALDSFSGSNDGNQKEADPIPAKKQKEPERKKKKSPKKKTKKKDRGVKIEETPSIDELAFKESSCTGQMKEYFGINPDSLVVKILVSHIRIHISEDLVLPI
jgi:hypothetical protein